jgi:hypothetical protein
MWWNMVYTFVYTYIHNIFIFCYLQLYYLYNIYFLPAVKFSDVSTFLWTDYENMYDCSLKSGKRAAIGQYNAKSQTTTSEQTVMSCNHQIKYQHVISSQISCGLLYAKFWAVPFKWWVIEF